MFYELKLKNGETYNLRMKSKSVKEYEDKYGSILNSLSDEKISTTINMLFYLVKDYNHGFTQDNAYDLYDKLVDEGYTFEDVLNIVVEGMVASGFFKKAQLEEVKEEQKKK